MTKPAFIHSKFNKRESQFNMTSDKHSRGDSQGAESSRSSDSNLNSNLTPTKRKLIQNCNTGTLLKIFETKTEIQTGMEVVGGAEVASPAKRRRCGSSRLIHENKLQD